MSHNGTSWAFNKVELKSPAWRVLVMLADRHNKDTLQCDPNQHTLASDCNMSRSAVNANLDRLEEAGYLVRVPRTCRRTNKNFSTFYILAFDFENPPVIEHANFDYMQKIKDILDGDFSISRVRKKDKGPVSGKPKIPCPENGDSRVRNPDSNPVREPVIEQFLSKLKKVYRKFGSDEETMPHLKAALDAGVDRDHILYAATEAAKQHKKIERQYIPFLHTWLLKKRWEEFEPVKSSKEVTEGVMETWAKIIKSGDRARSMRISSKVVGELINGGYVTLEECQAVGIA